jgi:hypothetical protein
MAFSHAPLIPVPHKSFTSPFLHCPSYPSREKEHQVERVEGRGVEEELGDVICSKYIVKCQESKVKNTSKELSEVLWCTQSTFSCSTFTKKKKKKKKLSFWLFPILCIWGLGKLM